MPYCAVKTCRIKRHSVEAKKDNIIFHGFPRRSELKIEWANKIGRPGWVPNASAVICSKHFIDSSKAKGNTKLLKGAIPTLHINEHVDEEPMANSVEGDNQPILTQMQEEENENVPSSENTFLPMEIKIETIEEPSNDPELLALERMVIVDIIKNIMGSLDLLVKSDPDSFRSTSVRIKIIEALFCYRHIVDDKDLNLALCRESDVFDNEHQPPKKIVTVVNVETKEEEINNSDILDEDISEDNNPNEDYEEVNFLTDEEEDLTSDEEDPEWESIKSLTDQMESKENMDEKSKKSINKMSVSKIKRLVESYKNRELGKTDKGRKESKNVDGVKKTPKKRESKQNTSVEATGSLVEFKVNEEVKMDLVLFVSAIPRFVCQICDVTLVSEHHLAVHKLLCRRIHFYYGNPKLEDFWNDLKCPLCDVKCNHRGNLGRHYITHRIKDIESAFAPLKEKHLNPNDAENNMRLLNDFIVEFERLEEENEQQFNNSLPSNQPNADDGTKDKIDSEKSENSVEHKKQTKKISHYLKFNLKKIVYDIDFDKGLYCNSCDMMFISKEELEVHKKKVNGTDAFVCNHCDKTFAIPTKLINHVKTHTGLYNLNSLYQNTKMEDLELCPRQLDYRIYACKYCLEMFVQEISLQSHMGYYKKNKKCYKKYYKSPRGTVSKRTLSGIHKLPNSYKRRSVDKKLQCNKCGKTYTNSSSLKEHLASHADQNKYYCECGKGFKSKLRLKFHINIVHNKKYHRVCEVCGVNVIYFNLRRHMRVHSSLKPYKCNYCNKTFKYKEAVTAHIRTHTLEKPWQCQYCEMAFSEKRRYNIHINIHEGKTPYKCNQCPNAFVSKLKLNKHLLKHQNCGV